MSPRTGRPKIENPMDCSIKLRFDKEMNEALAAYCEKHKILKPEAIRKGIRLLLEQDEK